MGRGCVRGVLQGRMRVCSWCDERMEVPDQQASEGRGGRGRGRAGGRFRFIKCKYPFYYAVLRSNDDWVDRGR